MLRTASANEGVDSPNRERLFEMSLDLLAIANFDGYFVEVNPSWSSTLGFSAEELCARPYLDFVHPEDREATIAQATGLTAGVDTVSFENRYLRRDGSYCWLSWNASASYDDGVIFAVARDVSDRRTVEDELARYRAELERSNAELEQFAYIASHDLQEPLRTVIAYTQLLARRYRGKLGEDADDFINFAVDGAHRMQTLINDLLTYSRVDSKAVKIEPVDVEALLGQVHAALRVSIHESRAAVVHGPLPTVLGDARQLGQLFQNLIGNALKFAGDAPPHVRIDATPVEGRWLFSVRDEGIGFEQEFAERIFGIFQRLHHDETHRGTGIGLAICKKIAAHHGSEIWAESRPGHGSTFYFHLAAA